MTYKYLQEDYLLTSVFTKEMHQERLANWSHWDWCSCEVVEDVVAYEKCGLVHTSVDTEVE